MANDYKNKNGSTKGQVVKMTPRPAKSPAKASEKKSAATAPKAPKERAAEEKFPEEVARSSAKAKTSNFKTQNIMENTMTKSTIAFDKLTKDAADMSREYSDACVKSSTILMKGFENIMGALVSMAQTSAEKQARFLKEAMSSKTINEFAEVQNKIAQANFDDFMSSATKISEMGVKVLTESSEPVNSQMTKAIQKATESMAA
jgi:phasin family protein